MSKPLNKVMGKSSTNEDITFYRNSEGINYSVYPPQTFLTFDYWIYMVPQYKPKNVLILGYGGGTVAGLIRLIWGPDVQITGVDLVPSPDKDKYNVNFIQADAREFVRECGSYDTVIVDLLDNEKVVNAEFVTDPDFIENLERIANYVIVNTLDLNMSAYGHLNLISTKTSDAGVIIHYYVINNEIPFLHPFRK